MDLDLKNRRVLVTGSTRGIGHGIARAFLAEGAAVMLTGREEATVTRRCRELRMLHRRARVEGFSGDLTNPSTIELLLDRCRVAWGGLDALVLNLGSGRSLPGMDVPSGEWKRMLDLNLVAAMETLRQAIPLLEKSRRASVTFIGSIAGREALGAPIAYGAAKAALEHAMKSASLLLGRRGIRVNLVAPGNIYFAGGTWARKMKEDRVGVARLLRDEVPLGRFGKISEVADSVLFLASPRASFITGASVVVDGGQSRAI